MTKLALTKALKSIARGKLTFGERVVVDRVVCVAMRFQADADFIRKSICDKYSASAKIAK